MSQKQYKPHYEHLKSKWTTRHNAIQKSLWQKHKDAMEWLQKTSQNVAIGSAAGLMLLTQPAAATGLAQNIHIVDSSPQTVERPALTKEQLIKELKYLLPQTVEPLSDEQEKAISDRLADYFHMTVKPELEGKRLNRSYGLIGAEQHLTRYPGDTMETHFDTEDEARFASSGMAPGRGAWGYFTDSDGTFNELAKQREKYYIAVPTFLAPGWNEDTGGHYKFFKFRKMLVVNPENGKAIVADIGDSGPAEWTGKHLGGSPEVMSYLERQDGRARGPVIYFFIDDHDDKIPLGPVTIQ